MRCADGPFSALSVEPLNPSAPAWLPVPRAYTFSALSVEPLNPSARQLALHVVAAYFQCSLC